LRVFVASLATETNTFSPLYVDRSAFETAFYCPPGMHPDTPTLCSAPVVAARRRAGTDGFTLIEGTATWAEPAGLVSRDAYESLRDEILGQIERAMPLDVVLFGLHGAMVARGYDDCEGDLLARTRAIVGPGCVIGAELDMHCHLTDKRVAAADVLVAFKEFPHTDFLKRAEDLVDLCLRTARGEFEPVSEVFDCRAMSGFMTSRQPGRDFVDRMLAMEGRDGILSVSIAHGFAAADVYDVGTKVLVVADGDANRPKAKALAEALGREILGWGPSGGSPHHYKPEEAVAQARAEEGQPIVFADRWDSPGGGVAGDSSAMVEVLLGRDADPELVDSIGGELAAPHLIDIEVLSVLRGLELSGKITAERAIQARMDFDQFRIARYEAAPFVDLIWARRHQVTAYDAWYVTVASVLEVPLVTCDARLERAVPDVEIRLFGRSG